MIKKEIRTMYNASFGELSGVELQRSWKFGIVLAGPEKMSTV